jgi:hypothetical protein
MTFLSCLFLNRWLRDKDFPYVPRWFRHTSRHNRIPKSRKWRIR